MTTLLPEDSLISHLGHLLSIVVIVAGGLLVLLLSMKKWMKPRREVEGEAGFTRWLSMGILLFSIKPWVLMFEADVWDGVVYGGLFLFCLFLLNWQFQAKSHPISS